MSPETLDWAARTETLLDKFDFMLPFSEIQNTVNVHQYLGPYPDPDNRWDDEIPSDGALALTRNLWERYQGLPFQDGITGRNSVRHFFQYEYRRKFTVPHCFRSKTNLGDLSLKEIRVGFTPRKLKWLKESKGSSQIGDLYIWALENRFHEEKHIQLNSTGGLEFSAAGDFLKAGLEALRKSSIRASDQGKISIKMIKIKELGQFAKEYLKNISEVDLIPISVEEAFRRQNNSTTESDEIGLVLGYIGDRCVAHAQVVPLDIQSNGVEQKSYSIYSAFVYHHLKPSGIVNRMFDGFANNKTDLIFCGDDTVSVGQYSKVTTRSAPEISR